MARDELRIGRERDVLQIRPEKLVISRRRANLTLTRGELGRANKNIRLKLCTKQNESSASQG